MKILSRRVENDEADLSGLIDEVLALSEEPLWAVDQPGGSAALLLALLWERDQRVLYLPGLAVERAREAYPGESKTDARDAYVIADQVRMRSNLARLVPGEDDLAELQLLLARRRDLVADRTRSRSKSVSRVGTLLRLMSSITPRTGKSGESSISPAGSAPSHWRNICTRVMTP
jgi:transposase